MPPYVRNTEQSFWQHVDKHGPAGCWLWTGHRLRNGYGQFRLNYAQLLVHRLAYEFTVGPIPAGLQIDHLCRIRSCVNPAHLEAVTQQENIRRQFAARKVAMA